MHLTKPPTCKNTAPASPNIGLRDSNLTMSYNSPSRIKFAQNSFLDRLEKEKTVNEPIPNNLNLDLQNNERQVLTTDQSNMNQSKTNLF